MAVVVGAGGAGCDLAAEMAALAPRDVLLLDDPRAQARAKRVPRARWLALDEARGLAPLARGAAASPTGLGRDPRRAYAMLRGLATPVAEAVTTGEGARVDPASERLALLAFSASDGAAASASLVLARALREASEDRVKSVAVVLLPTTTRDADAPGLRAAADAWFLVERALQLCDGVVLVEERAETTAAYVARALDDVLSAQPAESVEETFATLGLRPPAREPGVTALGRAVRLLHGPLGYALPFLPHPAPDAPALVRDARAALTVAEPSPAGHESAFLVARAPAGAFDRAQEGLRQAQLELAVAGCRRIATAAGTTERRLASVTIGLTYDPARHPRVEELREAARRHERQEGIAA